jgi:hypothetical protein
LTSSIAARAANAQYNAPLFVGGVSSHATRWKSTDVGDVIGIDLGTTNSCVAIMVSGLVEAVSQVSRLGGKESRRAAWERKKNTIARHDERTFLNTNTTPILLPHPQKK